MEQSQHDFSDLFTQLGLASDEQAIKQFCGENKLSDAEKLPDASFWTPAQAQFLRDSWQQDADWAPVIERLNISLRE